MDEYVASHDGVISKDACERGLPRQRSLACLPQDVLARVILKLPVEDILRLSCTCKSLRDVAMSDEDVWLPLVHRFMEHCTSPALWVMRRESQRFNPATTWPSSTYRQLYFTLRPFLVLDGIWLGTSLHQSSPGAPPDHVFAFKWTSSALLCLRLQHHTQGVHDHPQFWDVYHVLCKSSAAAPQLEDIGHGSFIMNPGVSHATDRASHSAQQHCAAAIGVRASPVLGTSPPGSFESELLTFLSGQQERSRQARRAGRRKSSRPPGAWPERMHLRRAAPVRASGTRAVLGVWTLVHHNSPQSPASCTIEVSFDGNASARRIQGVAIGALASSAPLWSVQLEWAKESGDDCQQCLQQLHVDVLGQLSALPEELLCKFQTSATGQTYDTCEDLLMCMGLQECIGGAMFHNRSSDLEPAHEDSLASLMNGMDDLHVEGPFGGWEVLKVFSGTANAGGASVTLLELMTPSQHCKRLLLLHPDGLQLFARLQMD